MLTKQGVVMTIKITPCKAEQLNLLRNISLQTYRDTFAESNSEALIEQYFRDALTPEKLLQEFNTVGTNFYFISLNDNIAGFLKTNTDDAQNDDVDKNALEIERLYVCKNYLRNGLGQRLIAFACELAQQKGKSCVWLGVWEGNVSALAFYKAQHFHQIGEHPFDMGGDIQTDLLLKKDI